MGILHQSTKETEQNEITDYSEYEEKYANDEGGSYTKYANKDHAKQKLDGVLSEQDDSFEEVLNFMYSTDSEPEDAMRFLAV